MQPTIACRLFLSWRKFSCAYQLEITSGLGMGHASIFLSSLGSDLVQTCAGPVHAALIPVSSNVLSTRWFRRPSFLGILFLLWLLHSFCLLFWRVPEGKDLMETSYLGLCVCRSPTLCTLSGVGLCVCSHLLPDETPDEDWARQGQWIQQNIVGSHFVAAWVFCLFGFSSVVFGFTLGSLTVWSQALGYPSSVGYGFHLTEWALS